MTYTPAQISAAKGGEPFIFDYAHADVVQTFTFGAGSWGLYTADNVAIGNSITANPTGAGTIRFSVTLFHLPTFASSHVRWDGTGVTVEYSLDNTTWNLLTEDGVVALDGDADFDIRVTFTDPDHVLNSLTAYVLGEGKINSSSRSLTIGNDLIADGAIVTSGQEKISAADATAGDVDGTSAVGAPTVQVGTVELLAVLSQIGQTILSSNSFSFAIDADGNVQATGCTVYVNGAASGSAPHIITGMVPYHFMVVPTAPVNEEISLGAGLTVSNLALYYSSLDAASVYSVYEINADGNPTIVINDTSAIGVFEGWVKTNSDTTTETMPAIDIYAYAWSIVSSSS